PHPEALAALQEARAVGLRVVVATGRPRRKVSRAVRDAADAVVLEGGALVWTRGGVRSLAPPEWADAARAWLEGEGLAFEAKGASFSIAAPDARRLARCPVALTA